MTAERRETLVITENQVPLDLLEKLDHRVIQEVLGFQAHQEGRECQDPTVNQDQKANLGDQETLDLRDLTDQTDLKEARVKLVYRGSQVRMGLSGPKDQREVQGCPVQEDIKEMMGQMDRSELLESLVILDRLDPMEILDQRVTKEEMGSTIRD